MASWGNEGFPGLRRNPAFLPWIQHWDAPFLSHSQDACRKGLQWHKSLLFGFSRLVLALFSLVGTISHHNQSLTIFCFLLVLYLLQGSNLNKRQCVFKNCIHFCGLQLLEQCLTIGRHLTVLWVEILNEMYHFVPDSEIPVLIQPSKFGLRAGVGSAKDPRES